MHYIIGTQIMVNQSKPAPTGPVSVLNMQPKKRRIDSPFEPGVMYVLRNIRSIPEGLRYTFDATTGEQKVIVFESAKDADKCIATALGEQLPDYDGFFRRSSA